MAVTAMSAQENNIVKLTDNAVGMFISMPDSMMPYLLKQQRTELVKLKSIEPDQPSVTTNVVEGKATLLHVSDSIVSFNPCENVLMEIGMLDADRFCLLKTIPTPELTTTCVIYNKEWKKVNEQVFEEDDFFHKPDTMSDKEYAELRNLVEIFLPEVHFSDSPKVIEVKANIPLLNKEEKEKIFTVILQRKLKWGVDFYN